MEIAKAHGPWLRLPIRIRKKKSCYDEKSGAIAQLQEALDVAALLGFFFRGLLR